MKDLVLLTGLGRSGTNWLLSLLDISSRTHCRNEPNEIENSPLTALDAAIVDPRKDAEYTEKWDAAVEWAATRLGNRDHPPTVAKDHIYSTSSWLGLTTLVRRHRTRGVLSSVMPSWREPEWLMPRWLGSRRRLREAVVVLKVLATAGWVDWLVRSRKDPVILHIVRHPGGFLNSWANRYLAGKDEDHVRKLNIARLKHILGVDDSWSSVFGDIEGMSAHEAELWFWRYSTEGVHRAGLEHTRYHHVIYEQLTADPTSHSREIYDACGLPWNDAIRARIEDSSRNSQKIARAWKDALSPSEVELVEKVLTGSLAEAWWDPALAIPSPSGNH